MSINEQQRDKQRAEWFKSQHADVERNTLLITKLGEFIQQNSPMMVASYLADCLRFRVWEQGWWDVQSSGEFYAHTCENAIEFLRERFFMEPAEMMNIIASPLPKAEDGAAAAIELIREVKAHEPDTFRLLTDKDNPSNWRGLLEANEKRSGGPWIEANAELDRESFLKPGGNKGLVDEELLAKAKALAEKFSTAEAARQLGRSKSTVRDWVSGRSTPKLSGASTTPRRRAASSTNSRSAIRRRLERYSADPELCKDKNTTQEKVKAALFKFMNGASAASCEREAGLTGAQERRVALRMAAEPSDVANRIVQMVKPDKARAIAEAILSQI